MPDADKGSPVEPLGPIDDVILVVDGQIEPVDRQFLQFPLAAPREGHALPMDEIDPVVERFP
jgi:hypothetical protein